MLIRIPLLFVMMALPAALAAQATPVAQDDLAPLSSAPAVEPPITTPPEPALPETAQPEPKPSEPAPSEPAPSEPAPVPPPVATPPVATPPVTAPPVRAPQVVAPPFRLPPPVYYPPLRGPRFNPAAEYVTAGQDEPGYRAWYARVSWRPAYVRAFHDYLVANGVSGVAPTWQLLRTATFWRRCGAEPFEVPPSTDWVNIVATLRFIGSNIVPVLGPVEPVSVYRNPALNVCAGGAQTSTHREMGAVDIVPLRPIRREDLMVQLCAIHRSHTDSSVGLGFYKGLRFHIDARKFREWGTVGARGGFGCAAVLAEGAAPFGIQPPLAPALPTRVLPPTAKVTDPAGLVLTN